MEEYLENLKSFRSYIKDAEDEATKRSAEEQRQNTTIETLEIDLNLVKSETIKANEETGEMVKENNKVECEITDMRKKITTLEIECSTLKQTLELLHQQISTVSENFSTRRLVYANTTENFFAQLKDQEEWIQKHKLSNQDELLLQVEGSPSKRSHVEGGYGFANEWKSEKMQFQVTETEKGLKLQLESTKQKIEALETKRGAILSETLQNKELLDQEKQLMETSPRNLAEMELNALEKEQEALLSDKAGEMEYIHSLRDRINALKEASCDVTCRCGMLYNVALKEDANNM